MKVTEKDLIGDIEDFPIEIVQRMVDCQVEQGNEVDITKIKRDKYDGGFTWSKTKEGNSFWHSIIKLYKFDVFFQRYPKLKPYPKVMLVWDEDETIESACKRVVFMEKKGKFLAWGAETLKKSEDTISVFGWDFAQDIPELPEKVTIKEKGIEVGGVELSIEQLVIILNQLKNEKE